MRVQQETVFRSEVRDGESVRCSAAPSYSRASSESGASSCSFSVAFDWESLVFQGPASEGLSKKGLIKNSKKGSSNCIQHQHRHQLPTSNRLSFNTSLGVPHFARSDDVAYHSILFMDQTQRLVEDLLVGLHTKNVGVRKSNSSIHILFVDSSKTSVYLRILLVNSAADVYF